MKGCVLCLHLLGYLLIMEVYSLEDDGFSGLFLTQESHESVSISDNRNHGGIIGDPMDFTSPCVGLTGRNNGSTAGVYEDISDDDDFNIPSSQVPASSTR